MLSNLAIFLLALSWIVADHFPPWFTFHTEVPAFIASIFGIISCYFHSQRTLIVPHAVFICFTLVGVAILQFLAGLLYYAGDAWIVSIYLTLFATAWFWGNVWRKTSGSLQVINVLALMFVFVGLATALQLFAQWLGIEQVFADWILEKIPDGRPRANIGQSNQAATTLVVAMISSAFLYAKNKICLNTVSSLIIMLVMAMTVTQSRTALLSVIAVAGGFLFFTRKAKDLNLIRLFVILWVVICFATAWIFSVADFGDSSALIGVQQMTSTGTRPLIWRQMLAAIMERPWFGWGWLQIPAAQQAGAIYFPGAEQTNYAHNIILDALVMLGIPLALTLLFVAIRGLCKRARFAMLSVDAKWAIALTTPIVVHSMLELPHAYAYFLVPAGLLFGVFDASTDQVNHRVLEMPRKALLLFIMLWITTLLYLGFEYMQSEEDFRVNRFENRRIGERASTYSIPKLVMLTQFDELLKAMRLRAAPNMRIEDVNLLAAVSKRYSWAALHFRTAVALGLNGRPEEATRQLRVIKSIFPEDIYNEAKINYKNLATEKFLVLEQVQIP